jgi:hypothetical protein
MDRAAHGKAAGKIGVTLVILLSVDVRSRAHNKVTESPMHTIEKLGFRPEPV